MELCEECTLLFVSMNVDAAEETLIALKGTEEWRNG
jgi:hypothetical protein